MYCSGSCENVPSYLHSQISKLKQKSELFQFFSYKLLFVLVIQPIRDWQLLLVVSAIALLDQCISLPFLILGIANGESVTPVLDLYQDNKLNVSI